MANTAFFIDLSNFYGHLLKSKLAEPKVLMDYFLTWLDFDLLAQSVSENYSGIWVFYSGSCIGPKNERIDGKDLIKFVKRINTLKGVTARDVNIPGKQRETIKYQCTKCKHEGISEIRSEKGIDSSLTVHLFDTMDSWETAFLLSGDADFVPVVASLRRRGKIVNGVGFSDASEALWRECYQYINIKDTFINDDLLVYKLFNKDGIIKKWLSLEVKKHPGFTPNSIIRLSVRLDFSNRNLSFNNDGKIDLSDRHQMFYELTKKYKGQVRVHEETCVVENLTYLGIEAIIRNVGSLLSFRGLKIKDHRPGNPYMFFKMFYQLDESTGKYINNPDIDE